MRALVLGGGGFLGGHLIKRLKVEGYDWVRAADIKRPEFELTAADQFVLADLRDAEAVDYAFSGQQFDEVYQLAADMGGAGHVFTGEHDAEILSNSARINLNVADACWRHKVGRVFFSSSACVYPANLGEKYLCYETIAYPAMPDSDYGWEKLMAERLYQAYARNYGLSVRIARLHNVYGPLGTWRGGREKAPAAICRKVAEAHPRGGVVKIWGSGEQTRSFMYVDDCIEGIVRLMRSDFEGPVNLGSEEMVSIRDLVQLIAGIAEKIVLIQHEEGPIGVQGRNSDQTLIRKYLNWVPSISLWEGLRKTYPWIAEQVEKANENASRAASSNQKRDQNA